MAVPPEPAGGDAPPPGRSTFDRVVEALRMAGCVAAEEEAADLVGAAARRGVDLDGLVDRRVTGEPLAWITGTTTFCGLPIDVHPGVFVPRWQTEPLARRAATALPETGVAVDLCTGAGAIAAVLRRHRPRASVLGTDIDPRAVACARANGVDALLGDLDAPLPADLPGRVDVVTSVVPYVPTGALPLLPRDTLAFEPVAALDGGPDGTRLLGRVIQRAPRLLRPGGMLFLEIGGDQAEPAAALLEDSGFGGHEVLTDEEGDVRGIVGRLRG